MGMFNKKKKVETQVPSTQEFAAMNADDGSDNNALHNTHQFEEFDASHKTHFQPVSYDNTGEIADTLIRFKEATVSFRNIQDKAKKRRVIDFLTGAMYALDGSYKKVDDGIFYFWIKTT